MTAAIELVHGTALAVGGRAVLIRGPSGAGKSDLALRCLMQAPGPLIGSSPELVGDDRVEVIRSDDRLLVRTPTPIRGLLEVRGLGILRLPSTDQATLALVADLAASELIERHPDPLPATEICGVQVPLIRIAPFEASAPLKLLIALNRVLARTP